MELISQKLGGKVLYKRDLTVFDASNTEVRLTLWGDRGKTVTMHFFFFKTLEQCGDILFSPHQNFLHHLIGPSFSFLFILAQESPPGTGSVIVVKNCKVGEYLGGKSLGTSLGEWNTKYDESTAAFYLSLPPSLYISPSFHFFSIVSPHCSLHLCLHSFFLQSSSFLLIRHSHIPSPSLFSCSTPSSSPSHSLSLPHTLPIILPLAHSFSLSHPLSLSHSHPLSVLHSLSSPLLSSFSLSSSHLPSPLVSFPLVSSLLFSSRLLSSPLLIFPLLLFLSCCQDPP